MAINFPTNPQNGDIFTDQGTSWQFDGVAWNVLGSTATAINKWSTFTADTGSTTADNENDIINIVGGTSIATTIIGDTLTVSYTGGSGDGGSDQNLWFTIAGDTGLTTPDSTTDTLNIVGGTDISTAVVDDTLTINFTGDAGGANALNDLTDVSTQGTGNGSILYNNGESWVVTTESFAKWYMPAMYMLETTAQDSTAYRFPSHYGNTNNPTLYAISGTTIAFDLTGSGGHPFEIQDPTGNQYNNGVVHVSTTGVVSTGASAQGKDDGYLYWQIPFGISGAYRYQCTVHVPMVGAISIKAFNAV